MKSNKPLQKLMACSKKTYFIKINSFIIFERHSIVSYTVFGDEYLGIVIRIFHPFQHLSCSPWYNLQKIYQYNLLNMYLCNINSILIVCWIISNNNIQHSFWKSMQWLSSIYIFAKKCIPELLLFQLNAATQKGVLFLKIKVAGVINWIITLFK